MKPKAQWVDRATVLQLTGWSNTTLWRNIKSQRVESRPSEQVSSNGKPILEYSVRSLPAPAQQKVFAEQLKEATSSQLKKSDPNQLSFPETFSEQQRDRVILPAAQEENAARRFAPVEALYNIKLRGPDHKGVLLTLVDGRELRTYREVVDYIAQQHSISAKTLWERPPPGVADTLTTTAVMAGSVYVTRVRKLDGKPVTAAILRIDR